MADDYSLVIGFFCRKIPKVKKSTIFVGNDPLKLKPVIIERYEHSTGKNQRIS
jgi:hypothetical protein